MQVGVDNAQCKPESGEVKYRWGHQEGLPGGGGLAVKLKTSTGSPCSSSMRTLCLRVKRIVRDIGRSRYPFWIGVLNWGSGFFSASNLLGQCTPQSLLSHLKKRAGQTPHYWLSIQKEKEKTYLKCPTDVSKSKIFGVRR